MRNDLHEANRLSWNAATRAHNSHKLDQAGFLRRGGTTLFPEELALLGDVRGLRIAHLQCNAGQDSLSLAARGALVTGVDISDEAITFARRLAADSGIAADFVRADVYDWLEREAMEHPASYDIVFSSYGFLCWLSDLTAWAKGIHAVLKPGGRFAAVEFHPLALCLAPDWKLAYDYGGGASFREDGGVSDYVGLSGEALAPSGFDEGEQHFCNPYPSYEFYYGLGEVVSALSGAGFALTSLAEYPYANGWEPFTGMRQGKGEYKRRRYPPAVWEGRPFPRLPLMFSLDAERRDAPLSL